MTAYYTHKPDASDPAQRVAFGTSGHRGSSLTEQLQRGAHPGHQPGHLRIPESKEDQRPALHGHGYPCPVRSGAGHAPSRSSPPTGSTVMIQKGFGYTPTPVISHAILTYNRGRKTGLADGVVITPSHNPPEDGGFKYNPPEGGPADTETTRIIEERANALLAAGARKDPQDAL